MNPIAFCSYPTPTLWLFSENVPPLVYYSHLPLVLVALFLGVFVLIKGRSVLVNQILFGVLAAFAGWVFLDSVFWAANRSDVIMFVWSLQILIEPLVHIGALYMMYVMLYKEDASFNQKILFVILYLPILLMVPTQYSLIGFDVGTCLANEHLFSYYTYLLEVFATIAIVHIATLQYIKAQTQERRTEIILLTTGMILFLLSFSWGAIVGSFTDDWGLAQYGLFGMPIFGGFLAYSIVKFKTFNIRLIGAQALVAGLAVVSGSQYFFSQSKISLILNTISFAFIIIFGGFIIRSVQKEIESREKQQELAGQLQRVNSELAVSNTRLKALSEQKSEFISFATHQLRSPLTAIKGYVSMLLEGDYGKVPNQIKDVLQTIFISTRSQTSIVEDYLNISRIELGTMKYDMIQLDFREVVQSAIDELKASLDEKKLESKFEFIPDEPFTVSADPDKIKQVIMNITDNAIKYTDSGHIYLALIKDSAANTLKLKVEDTGVGIREDVLPKLFQKFTRAPKASEANIHGTGLGLYIAREIVMAHGGKIWAESAGEGKGSKFYVELPLVK
jgi:signal transduction histidine kinase